MHDITFIVKNCPPQVEAMIQSTFKLAPTQVMGKPLEESPLEPMTIDFNTMKDKIMVGDVGHAVNVLLMAFSWLIVKERRNEVG